MSIAPPRLACSDCPIRHRAVCAECDADELALLETSKTYRTFAKGDQIAWAGEELGHLSSVVSGAATMSRTLADGRRQIVGLLLPSDFIGRPGRSTSPYDIVAATELTLCRFERARFEEIVRTSENVAHRLLTMTLDELDAVRDWSVVLGRMTAREKVANVLVSLARRTRADDATPRKGPIAMTLPLPREALADYLGLTIETTSRQFSRLKSEGLILVPGPRDVVIPDLDRLALELADDDGGVWS